MRRVIITACAVAALSGCGGSGSESTTTTTATTEVAPTTTTTALAPTYTVQAGDTLGAIASRVGTTVAVLVELNELTDPNVLEVGQVLRLPPP